MNTINDAMDIITENYYNLQITDLYMISCYKEMLQEIKLQARQWTLDAFSKNKVDNYFENE
jgi:hypothetical protein